MQYCDILACVWGKKDDYGLVDEEILQENTFMQQTSGKRNLWKAQLGITDNHVIFLRCDPDPIPHTRNHNSSPEHVNVMINMIPMSHLDLTRHGRRKLKIVFPSGVVCYFKLLICPGCGTAWKRWKALEQKRDDSSPLVSRSSLICLSTLDPNLRKKLVKDKFVHCFTNFRYYFRDPKCSVLKSSIGSDEIRSPISTDSGVKSDISLKDEDDEEKEKEQYFKGIEEETDAKGSSEKDIKVMENRRGRKKKRKTRQIRRFGEGIPENCSFELTLSYSDEAAVSNGTKTEIDEQKSELGLYDDSMSLEERAIRMMSRSLTDSEESVIETAEAKYVTSSSSSTRSSTTKYKIRYHTMKKIERKAQFFTNISLLIIPRGLRRGKSVDSVSKIPATKSHKIYLTRSSSLPNANEMILNRRFGRLNFSTNLFNDTPKAFASKNHFSHPVSFWLSDKISGGRIYCTVPICRKISAEGEVCRRKKYNALKRRTIDDYLGVKNGKKVTEETQSGKISRTPSSDAEEIPQEFVSEPNNKELVDVKIQGRENETLDPSTFEPVEVAYELHVIQQTLFCEIETSELARYILKPHTVTEVNCPYLCGFLFFFERLKKLATFEVSAEKVNEAVRIYHLLVQTALASFKRRDEQSAYALLSGLCSPVVMKNRRLWKYLLQDDKVVNDIMDLLKICCKRRKLQTTHQKVPFFLNFLTFIIEHLVKEEPKFPSLTEMGPLWNFLTKVTDNFQETESNRRRNKRVFSELRALTYGKYERVFAAIEECRKCFTFENIEIKNAPIRDYLLYKKFER